MGEGAVAGAHADADDHGGPAEDDDLARWVPALDRAQDRVRRRADPEFMRRDVRAIRESEAQARVDAARSAERKRERERARLKRRAGEADDGGDGELKEEDEDEAMRR